MLLPQGLTGCVLSVAPQKFVPTPLFSYSTHRSFSSFKFLGFWITELVTGKCKSHSDSPSTVYTFQDFTVMALTAYRTYDAYWKMRVFKNHPLWDVIIKDGMH